MFCTKCGAPNEDSSAFCFKCGAKLVIESTQPEQAAPVEEQISQTTAPSPVMSSNKKKKYTETASTAILAILIVVILLATYTNIFSGIGLGGSSKVTFTSDFEETYSGGGPFVIDSSGTVWTIHSGGYMIQKFGNNVPFSISGTFSSNAKVTAFIIGESDWNLLNVTDHGNVAKSDMNTYVITTGDVETGSLQTSLSAGNYYIVIYA